MHCLTHPRSLSEQLPIKNVQRKLKMLCKAKRECASDFRVLCSVPELGRDSPCSKARNFSNTSTVGNSSCNLSRSLSTRRRLALELGQQGGVFLAGQSASSGRSALEKVDYAVTAKRSAALLVGGGIRGAEELAFVVCDYVLDVEEDIALEETASTSVTALKKMALDVRPDIVDGVKESLARERRATASGLGDVVVLHGDCVASADHLEDPVMVAVATCRVVGGTVDEVAGECDTGARGETKNVVLTTGTSSLVCH